MKKRTEYHKLVRDRIPEIISADGEQPITHILDDAAFIAALHEKLREEAEEVIAATLVSEVGTEIADVLEVMRALAQAHGTSWDDVEKARVEKAQKRGGFEKRIFLEATEKE